MDIKPIRAKIEHLARPAFIPQVTDGDGALDDSKFSGTPWIASGDEWPICGYCNNPMQLVLQLNLSTCPHEFSSWSEKGLLQIFYCLNEGTYCEEAGDDCFSPFGKFLVARVIENEGTPESFKKSPLANCLPAMTIKGWREIRDFPAPLESGTLTEGKVTEEEEDFLFELTEGYSQSWRDEGIPEPLTFPQDKVAGWPMWLQDRAHPECPECGTEMEYILQIASNVNFAHGWGDCGIAQLFRCPTHVKTMGFSWAGC